jgi:hypothetical protein
VAAGVAVVVEKVVAVVEAKELLAVVGKVVKEVVALLGVDKARVAAKVAAKVADKARVAAKVVAKVADFCEEMALVWAQTGCQGKERLGKAIGYRFQRGIGIMGHSFLLFCHCCFCFYCFFSFVLLLCFGACVWDAIELL